MGFKELRQVSLQSVQTYGGLFTNTADRVQTSFKGLERRLVAAQGV